MKILCNLVSTISAAGITVGLLYIHLPLLYMHTAHLTGTLPITTALEEKFPVHAIENKLINLENGSQAITRSRTKLLHESRIVENKIAELKELRLRNQLLLENARMIYRATPEARDFQIYDTTLSAQDFGTEIESIHQTISAQSESLDRLQHTLAATEFFKRSLANHENQLFAKRRKAEETKEYLKKHNE